MPHYQLLIESYDKAQNVQKIGRETKLENLNVEKMKLRISADKG